jgi:hypothetical protein
MDSERLDAHWERVAEINAFGPFSRVNCPEAYPPFGIGTQKTSIERVSGNEITGPACVECGNTPVYRGNVCRRCWSDAHD